MESKLTVPEVTLPTDAGAMVELIRSRVDYAGLTQAITDAEAKSQAAWQVYEAAQKRLADHEATEPAPEAEPNGLEIWAMQRLAMQGALPSYERAWLAASAEVNAAKRALADALMRAQGEVDAQIQRTGLDYQSYAYHRADELRYELAAVQGHRWPGAEKLSQAHRALKEAKQLLKVY